MDHHQPERTAGEPLTIRRIWREHGMVIRSQVARYGVPIELVLATIATESGGNPDVERPEPHLGTASVGLMQTLITTAQDMLPQRHVTREWLLDPKGSIIAGMAYIEHQASQTLYDPPVVACAYNAGGVYQQGSRANRWRMRQHPIGTGQHADRFVLWFNDAMAVMRELSEEPVWCSFHALLEGQET